MPKFRISRKRTPEQVIKDFRRGNTNYLKPRIRIRPGFRIELSFGIKAEAQDTMAKLEAMEDPSIQQIQWIFPESPIRHVCTNCGKEEDRLIDFGRLGKGRLQLCEVCLQGALDSLVAASRQSIVSRSNM